MEPIQILMEPLQKLIHYYCQMKMPSEATLPIHEHLDTLRRYASRCEHVTEMGFRYGVSFSAFLMAQPRTLVTYDLEINRALVDNFSEINCNTNIFFKPEDTTKIVIEETDLLFIDTLHTYTQLKKELELHAHKVRRYLIFHDTETFGYKGEDGSEPGLLTAIREFLEANPEWHLIEVFQNNNGLIILSKSSPV